MDILPAKIVEQIFGVEKETPVRRPRTPEEENAADHWTTPVLLERAAYLRKLAKFGNGSAIETINDCPQHCFMLSFRARSSEAEVHERFTQMLFVLDGTATLISGEVPHPLRAGDMAHIPAGQPHQFLVSGGKTLACLVLQIQETA